MFVKVPNQTEIDWCRREVIPFCVMPRDGKRRQKPFERVKIIRIGVGDGAISISESTDRESYRK